MVDTPNANQNYPKKEFYKKKIIRDFLTLFSESKWKNLCILCMEYGVLMLK